MLSVNLDDEMERYLVEILREEKITISELLEQMLRERLSRHQPRQTVLERMGGLPEELSSDPGFPKDLSDRDVRKAMFAEHLEARHRARHE